MDQRDRPASTSFQRGDHADAVEVTSQMVDAGLAELWPGEMRPYQDEAEVLGRVFVAMVNAQRGRQ